MKKLMLTIGIVLFLAFALHAGDVNRNGTTLPDTTDVPDMYALVNGYLIKSNVVVNSDINSAAAIDGSKVNPVFGAQALTTTGNLLANNVSVSNDLSVHNSFNFNDVLYMDGGLVYYNTEIITSALLRATATNLTITRNLSVGNVIEAPLIISGNTTQTGNLSVSSINSSFTENIFVGAWAQYDENPLSIQASYNIDSVEFISTGNVRVWFDTPFRSAQAYSIIATSENQLQYLFGDTTAAYADIGTYKITGGFAVQEGDGICFIAVGK